jgi:hypothetical protein
MNRGIFSSTGACPRTTELVLFEATGLFYWNKTYADAN